MTQSSPCLQTTLPPARDAAEPGYPSQNARIVIADDHPLVRHGVRMALTRSEQNHIVGEASNSDEALRMVLSLRPDLLILDLQMPGMSAEELIAQALAAYPSLKILVLTSHDDEKTVQRLKKVRIAGYMLKSEAPESLLQAVHIIQHGAVWFSKCVAHKMMGLDIQDSAASQLTPRELQILALLAKGLDNHRIAEQVKLAEQTVRNYVTVIYEKIGVCSRVEAVVWAYANGLISAG